MRFLLSILEYLFKRPLLLTAIIIVAIPVSVLVTFQMLHETSQPEFCETCHNSPHPGIGGEFASWKQNIHGIADVTCMDCHGNGPGFVSYFYAKSTSGLKDLFVQIFAPQDTINSALREAHSSESSRRELVSAETCLFCHSDEYNKKMRDKTLIMSVGYKFRNIDYVENPSFRQANFMKDILKDKPVGVDPNHKVHVVEMGVGCVECHTSEVHSSSKVFASAQMQTCFTCHDSVKDTSSNPTTRTRAAKERFAKADVSVIPDKTACETCHTLQVESFAGEMKAVPSVPKTPSAMSKDAIGIGCVECHTNPEYNTPEASPFAKASAESCASCHDAKIMDETQSKFKERRDAILNKWVSYFTRRANFNAEQSKNFAELSDIVRALKREGSLGVHNLPYLNAIMDRADKLFGDIGNVERADTAKKE